MSERDETWLSITWEYCMAGKLEDRVARITGASRGIGKAIALELGAQGAHVVVTARTEQSTAKLPGSIGETAAAIREAGGRAIAIRLDVRSDDEIRSVTDKIIAELGRIDVLVNNAGILGGGGPFLGGDPDLLDRFYRTNLRAPYVLSQIVGEKMAAQGGGAIFNISSGLARIPAGGRARGGGPGSVYGASKAALDRFAAGVAPELRERNIAIINVYPGFTLTETMAQRLPPGMDTSRMERPETAAKAVAFLCLDPMAHTGQIVVARELVDEKDLA